MIRQLRNRYDFQNLQRDRWLGSRGLLSPEQVVRLRVREIRYAQYEFVKRLFCWPVSVWRGCVNLVLLLKEHEILHAKQRRRMKCGSNCVIDRQTWIVNGQNIEFGDNVKVSVFSTLIAGYDAPITVGENTIMGPGVIIVAINHGTALNGEPIRYQAWREASVRIGRDVWIGGGVVILPGSVIGDGAVIGAGAIVIGEVPARAIAVMRNGVLTFKDRR